MSIQLTISSTAIAPQINGSIIFDGNRNTRKASAADVASGLTVTSATGAKVAVKVGDRIPFLQPVIQHALSQTIASGKNDITTIPISFKIRALWLLGSIPGNLYAMELLVDGTKILEATAQQIYSAYAKYGYQLGNVSVAASPTIGACGYGGATMGNPTTAGQIVGGALVPTTIPNGAFQAANLGNQGVVGANGLFPFDLAWVADMDGRLWEALLAQQSLILRVYSNVAQTLTTIIETLPGGYVS